VRKAVKQLAYITLSLRAFLRPELERLRHGVSWYESKISVIRAAPALPGQYSGPACA